MANGVYMGARAMRAEKINDLRSLAVAIEQQLGKFAKGMGARKLIDKGGDILKSFLPGIGHVVDFSLEELIGKRIPIGDEKKIEKFQTPWTGIGYAEEFQKMKKEATPSVLESILDQGLHYTKGKLKQGKSPFDFESSSVQEGYRGWEEEKDYNIFSDIYGGIRDSFPKRRETEKDKFNILDYLKGRGRRLLPDFMPEFEKGGKVPMYYGGGSVQGGTPTIAGYFSQQGKTLGGSNKQSVAEMLGRR
tara:strand:+ start:1600 stop:2340 length:741 start_codon:yes stop_codon:yes gene_type:complete